MLKSVPHFGSILVLANTLAYRNTVFFQGMAPDPKYVESVARTIAQHAGGPKIVVEKSTVPVKAAQSIATILREAQKHNKELAFQVSFSFSFSILIYTSNCLLDSLILFFFFFIRWKILASDLPARFTFETADAGNGLD